MIHQPATFLVAATGCRSNRCDAEKLQVALASLGLSERRNRPDVAILFGCVVTAAAEAKSRRLASRLAGMAQHAYAAGCTGCLWSEVSAALPRRALLIAERAVAGILPHLGFAPVGFAPAGFASAGLATAVRRTRYHLKIQEGCPGGCSFCIVPRLRPGSQSLPLEAVLAEASQALEAGHPEIVLTGVHLGLYGKDLRPAESLSGLVRRLLPLFEAGRNRLRLSSIEPLEIDDALLRLASENPSTFAPYFHLPMQSADTGVLERMGRNYSPGQFMEVVSAVRRAVPSAGIGIDVMVGFPGEDERAFSRTLDMIKAVAPVRTHVFAYSPRPGTPAVAFPEQVSEREKRRRASEVALAARLAARQYADTLTGGQVEVVWEKNGGYNGQFLRCNTIRQNRLGGRMAPASVKGWRDDPVHATVTLLVEPLDEGG